MDYLGANVVILGASVSRIFAIGALALNFVAFCIAPLFGIEMQGIELEPNSPIVP